MAYNNFTLETVLDKFELSLLENRFCQLLPPIDPTNYSLLPVQKILGILKWILSQ